MMVKTFRLNDSDIKIYEHLKKFTGFKTDIDFFRHLLQQAYKNEFGEEERSNQLRELQKINERLNKIEKDQKEAEELLVDIHETGHTNLVEMRKKDDKNNANILKILKYCGQILLQNCFTNKGNTPDNTSGIFAKTRERIMDTYNRLTPR